MRLSWRTALTIARREFLTTVTRKAFLFTAIGMPLYFAFVMWMAIRPQLSERREALRSFESLGVVDSSGLYAGASREIRTVMRRDPFQTAGPLDSFRTTVSFYPDQAAAARALRARQVSQVLVIPADYLATGNLRRYARSSGLFSSGDERPIVRWLVLNLLAGEADSLRRERAARPAPAMNLYALSKEGRFELKDDRREMFEFFMPFMFGMLLGLCIVTGGQYLLQGVSEEKESRILESMLCAVTAAELLAGKLLGLGGAGLTLVALWLGMGGAVAAPAAALLQFHFPPLLLGLALVYFLLGYLFYASLMIGIGAMTNNMREAQQFSFAFTFANFVPFLMLSSIIGHPDAALALGLSLFPPTAATTMMMRLAAPGAGVPAWQMGLSLAILAGSSWLTLVGAARIFRIGLLMYGKTPSLPEILRWARRG